MTNISRRSLLLGGAALGALAHPAMARHHASRPSSAATPTNDPASTSTPAATSTAASTSTSTSTSQAIFPNLLLPADTYFTPNGTANPAKKVFAHYMVCLPIFGGPSGGSYGAIPAREQEILMAQSMGLDGFVLNCGAWFTNSNYPEVVSQLFQAAANLGTGFLFFFSADMTGLDPSITPGEGGPAIVNMMETYAGNANYFTYNGQPVLSTFGGQNPNGVEDDPSYAINWWQTQVFEPLAAAGITPFFVPGFYNVTTGGTPAAEVAAWGNLIQGMIRWDVIESVSNSKSGTPAEQCAAYNESYSEALQAAGKLWMPGLFNLYWGSKQPTVGRRYFEFQGGIGAASQWQSIIENQNAPWVEILTWNDLNESYMMPIDDPAKYNDWGVPTGWWENHSAYGEIDRYYISWFKTGEQPTITEDALFFVYRTQSYTLTASDDPEGPVTDFLGPVANDIYITTALTAPGTVSVTSGGSTTSYAQGAGLSSFITPFAAGAQSFSVVRNGATVVAIGGASVVTQETLYDFWNTTGYVES
ncbi:MAG TPA: endo-1,3-alpha-glucanase family glycosylhydrolase [Stellaceae bacterium]|nr:endo-1,3-alpha-glucanase family glycosylhydrolase [Stellaceae bacterium]